MSRYDIPAERLDDAIESFREALEGIRALAGFRGGHVLIDREGDCATTITYWDDAASAEASAVTASRLRTDAARAADGSVTSSHTFAVAYTADAAPVS